MKNSTYIFLRTSMGIVSFALAFALVNDIAGTHWFGGYDKQLMGIALLMSLPLLAFADPMLKEGLRRKQARRSNPDAYPKRTFSNKQRFAILGIAALPALIIAANCFVGNNWFGHYGLIAVLVSIGGLVIVNSLVGGPKRDAKEGRRQ